MTTLLLSQFSLGESESLRPILAAIPVVSRCIATVAAIWVRGITIRLDLTCRWAGEASGTRIELGIVSLHEAISGLWVTYASSSTSPNIIRQARLEQWITHEDGCLHHIHRRS